MESDHDDCHTGHSLCAAAVAEDAGVHSYGGVDAGAGDWGECCDLYTGERGSAEETAGCRSEDTGAAGRQRRLLRYRRDEERWELWNVLNGHVSATEEKSAGV